MDDSGLPRSPTGRSRHRLHHGATERHGGGTEMALHDEDITEAIIGGAIEVHRHLGPGLLESA